MKTRIFAALLISYFFCRAINAQTYDNIEKEYVLSSLTEGETEAGRTHRLVLCDSQPSGLYVKKGERVTLEVSNLNPAYVLSSMIGFKPMWGDRNKTQEDKLKNGVNLITATQDGILSFIFVKRAGYDTNPSLVEVSVEGGKAFPLYQLNVTSAADWQDDLKTMTDARFVQLISDKVLITLPYKDYLKFPLKNIPGTFKTIHNVVAWEDELAGFDNSSPENARTRNRLHYLVDLYSTPQEQEEYYMYASDYLIGMKKDNFTDLTEKLSTEWGIWHETGHTHQQKSWTFDAVGEVSVNIFSLYVQEKFGLPSRLNTKEDGETQTTFEKAKKYVSQPNKNYLEENEDDYNQFFTKLVMFHQLKAVYGWDAIKKLHQHFRKKPHIADDTETDEEKANKFVYAMCLVTKNNLVPFFKKWGITIDTVTTRKINSLNLPPPSVDPSGIFR